MPELPEVETVVTGLTAAGLPSRQINKVKVFWPRSVAPAAPAAFMRGLTGRRIETLQRRAKYICMILDNGNWLLVHLRMTGRLLLMPRNAPTADRHDRVSLFLDDGRELRLHDTRKFARMIITGGPRDKPLATLGPEPLEPGFDLRLFRAILKRNRAIKPLLLDQQAIAGIGNIYADEALWDALIHPLRKAASMDEAETARLRRAIRRVLRQGIRSGGTSLGNGQVNFMGVDDKWGNNAANLKVFRRHGCPCPRCGTRLERLIVVQRATHICPACQPA